MCLSCTDDDESQQMNPPPLAVFVSASSFLSPQGREAANRHQGREQAFILSAVPFLLKSHFLLFSIFSPLRDTKLVSTEMHLWVLKTVTQRSWNKASD